ncbi:hypothetical protein, partial [Pseudomonas fluorescens]|uniref:hypothetical protein n=1 Tax=Pseudomonas fluorescens TaxID=294 RepID=UPI001CD2F540
YRYTFSTLASGRIMASWLLRESGAQHPGSAKRFECGVYGALTLDIDPSIFRKPTSEHRKLLNKYIKDLVSRATKETDEPSVDALKIRNIELTRKVSILEKELKSPNNKLALVAPKIAKTDPGQFDLDSLCMLIDDILKCQRNLQFKDGALYNLETFSEEDELVSANNNCKVYLEWKNGR